MSARSVKISRAGSQYINKYLKTQIANGTLQVVNSTSDALYFFKGSEILDNVNVILPVLQGDDTVAFQNNNNNFSGVQTFTKGIVSQGGLLLLPDPLGQLDDDLQITDGLNLVLGINQGTEIGTNPAQLLGFFGNDPINQPGVTTPSTPTTMVQDMWNALVNLGLISSQAASSSFSLPSTGITGPLPSQVGYRYGVLQSAGSNTLSAAGEGLLNLLSTTGGSVSSPTFINNRPAMLFTTSSGTHNKAGFHTNSAICTMQNNPTMVFKVATNTNSNNTLELGLVSSTTLGGDGTGVMLNGISGVVIGFDYSASTYSVVTNNGNASETVNTTGLPSLQTAGTAAIFTLVWNNSVPSVKWTIQTGPTTSTTGTISTGNLPASTTQMFLWCSVETGGSTATNTITVEDVEISLGSDMNVF